MAGTTETSANPSDITSADLVGRWLLTSVDLHDGGGPHDTTQAGCHATFTASDFRVDIGPEYITYRAAPYRISGGNVVHFQAMLFPQGMEGHPSGDAGSYAFLAIQSFGQLSGPVEANLTGKELVFHIETTYLTTAEMTQSPAATQTKDRTFAFTYQGPG